MYYSRDAETILKEHINSKTKHKNVLLVAGARQTGKSTMIEHSLQEYKNKIVINLSEGVSFLNKLDKTEEFSEFEELLKDNFNFSDNGKILYIDEAQLSTRLGRYVRFMKEKWTSTTVILSGSMLSELFTERYPVGRVRELVLRPFTFLEFLKASEKHSLSEVLTNFKLGNTISDNRHASLIEQLNSYFMVGGLPDVVKSFLSKGDWKSVRETILTGFKRDFETHYGREKAALVWQAFKKTAYYVGSPSKYTQVVPSGESGYKSVPEIISKLEAWHLVLNSEQQGAQPENPLHPKRYLFDIGTLQQLRYAARPLPLLGDTSDASTKQALGGALENYVATALIQAQANLSGYRTANFEVDFLLSKDVTPVEVKASNKVKLNFAKGLEKYIGDYERNFGICLTLAPPVYSKERNIYFLPAYLSDRLNTLTI